MLFALIALAACQSGSAPEESDEDAFPLVTQDRLGFDTAITSGSSLTVTFTGSVPTERNVNCAVDYQLDVDESRASVDVSVIRTTTRGADETRRPVCRER